MRSGLIKSFDTKLDPFPHYQAERRLGTTDMQFLSPLATFNGTLHLDVDCPFRGPFQNRCRATRLWRDVVQRFAHRCTITCIADVQSVPGLERLLISAEGLHLADSAVGAIGGGSFGDETLGAETSQERGGRKW